MEPSSPSAESPVKGFIYNGLGMISLRDDRPGDAYTYLQKALRVAEVQKEVMPEDTRTELMEKLEWFEFSNGFTAKVSPLRGPGHISGRRDGPDETIFEPFGSE